MTTGLIQVGRFRDSESLLADFRVVLVRFQPREIVFDGDMPEAMMAHIRDLPGVVMTKIDRGTFKSVVLNFNEQSKRSQTVNNVLRCFL